MRLPSTTRRCRGVMLGRLRHLATSVMCRFKSACLRWPQRRLRAMALCGLPGGSPDAITDRPGVARTKRSGMRDPDFAMPSRQAESRAAAPQDSSPSRFNS
jgi:hypothetical protein